MTKARRLCLALVLAMGLGGVLPAAEAGFEQQFSAWFSLNDENSSTPRLGLRYQPALSLATALGLGDAWKLDSEFSLDLSASAQAADWHAPETSGRIRFYRMWLRLAGSRFEARLGLQKINFGSAAVFRPLMWFDRIDVRDPLQVTDGVYGLLLRYYFKDNANIWLWGLYGNRDAKGWEARPTADKTPEFGGRFQAPLFSGEAGITVHQRRLKPAGDGQVIQPTENRLALDGKWDLGVGLWVEASGIHQDDPVAALPWQRSLALGVDYTFKLGNGVYLLAEQFFSQAAPALFDSGENGASLSALMARYPLSLLDSLGAMFYFDWRQKQSYTFISWQRTYDRWQFHVMLFWNPRQALAGEGRSGNSIYSGRGFQLMAVWNI